MAPWPATAGSHTRSRWTARSSRSQPSAHRGRRCRTHDRRWTRIKRPLVIVGGELTIETMDLVYSRAVGFYEAPFQMKANGGTLVIDDFGRQRVDPRDLLNRWIIPLEGRVDYLTFHKGKKIEVPFELMLIFATNLNPADLVDQAFLQRMGSWSAARGPSERGDVFPHLSGITRNGRAFATIRGRLNCCLTGTRASRER